jgi:pimeloyl-ACP methyl ester carboxylesterase
MTSSELLPSTRVGSGEPLLLLHGLGTSRDDFDRVTPLLERHFDVIAVDLPGQGQAPAVAARPTIDVLADALEADLDARGLEQVHMLGNSLGARLALELARRGRARSVVAIAPSGLSTPPERLFQVSAMALTSLAIRALRPVIPAISKRRAGRIALLAGLRARPWGATVDEARALIDGFGAPEFWRLLCWAIAADVPFGLDEISCPVLLAQGSADGLAAGQTIRFLSQVDDARFRVLPWAGHAAQGDIPAHVAQLVRLTAARAVTPDLSPRAIRSTTIIRAADAVGATCLPSPTRPIATAGCATPG